MLSASLAKFRVEKVVVEGPDGILIGEADGISPEKFRNHLISLVGILSVFLSANVSFFTYLRRKCLDNTGPSSSNFLIFHFTLSTCADLS